MNIKNTYAKEMELAYDSWMESTAGIEANSWNNSFDYTAENNFNAGYNAGYNAALNSKNDTLKTDYDSRYKKQQKLNEEHVKNPQIGDFWHEMFSPYFLVVGVVETGVIVLDETISISKSHYKFDETKPKFISLESLKERVTYPTMRDKFVANVRVKDE